MIKKAKELFEFIKEVFTEFGNDKALKLSAALSYYTIFSIAPLLIILISVTGFFFGREAIEGELYLQLNDLLGSAGALQLQEMIRKVHLSENSRLANIISIVVLVIGATSIFAEIQDSINHIWNLKSKPKRGLLKMVLNRLLSFSLIVSLGFLLIVSLTISALITGLSHKLERILPYVDVYLIDILDNILTFIITAFLFSVIFKVLPDAKVKWKDTGVGAIVTSLLFMVGKFLIGFYISQSNLADAYGAAGSVIVIMVWVYYSAVILYFGAEFTQVYALRYGGKIYPNEYAVWIRVEEREIGKTPQ